MLICVISSVEHISKYLQTQHDVFQSTNRFNHSQIIKLQSLFKMKTYLQARRLNWLEWVAIVTNACVATNLHSKWFTWRIFYANLLNNRYQLYMDHMIWFYGEFQWWIWDWFQRGCNLKYNSYGFIQSVTYVNWLFHLYFIKLSHGIMTLW